MADFIIEVLYKSFEDFFNGFRLVSGKASIRVVVFTGIIFIVTLLCDVFDVFCIMSWYSALLAFLFTLFMSGISVFTRRDVIKFKTFMKGVEDTDAE